MLFLKRFVIKSISGIFFAYVSVKNMTPN